MITTTAIVTPAAKKVLIKSMEEMKENIPTISHNYHHHHHHLHQ